MSALIPLLPKVQIMEDRLQLALADLRKHDLHVEFAPSLLLNAEWRLGLVLLGALAERFVQVEGRLLEAVRGKEFVLLGVLDV